MERFFVIVFCLLSSICFSAEETMEISGFYLGENLYVQNPYSKNGTDFCISKVLVNGNPVSDEIEASAFEIDFSSHNLELGQNLIIAITHEAGCKPTIINPEVLVPKTTFIAQNIQVADDGTLSWTTIEEMGALDFYVEQFKWNRWVVLDTVRGKGRLEKTNYSTKINFISGLNKFRVRQIDSEKTSRTSSVVQYKNITSAVTYSLKKNKDEGHSIIFSKSTQYEIYNSIGKFERNGYAKEVSIVALAKGKYFLNYDNKSETFEKK